MATFPYISDDTGIHPLSQQAIFLGVASALNGTPLLQVSTVNSITTTAISANQSLSAVLLGGTSFVGDVSAIVNNSLSATADNFRVSSLNQDANFMHVSGFSPDGGLFRVSAFDSVVTTNTGGASFFSTSGGIAQISTVKSTAGRLYGYHLGNPAGVDQYLQVFNASGGATLGTDVPALTLVVPAGTGSNQGAGAVMSLGQGIGFSNGIQVAATSTATGNTAGASAMRVNIFFA